ALGRHGCSLDPRPGAALRPIHWVAPARTEVSWSVTALETCSSSGSCEQRRSFRTARAIDPTRRLRRARARWNLVLRRPHMVRNWTFGRKVGGGFAVTVLAIVAIAVTGFRSATSSIDHGERVSHTREVQRQLVELLLQLVNAETGQRGFVITAK